MFFVVSAPLLSFVWFSIIFIISKNDERTILEHNVRPNQCFVPLKLKLIYSQNHFHSSYIAVHPLLIRIYHSICVTEINDAPVLPYKINWPPTLCTDYFQLSSETKLTITRRKKTEAFDELIEYIKINCFRCSHIMKKTRFNIKCIIPKINIYIDASVSVNSREKICKNKVF